MAPAVGSRGSKRKSGSTNASVKEERRGCGGEAVACVSEDDCVISPIVVLKKRYDMKRYEQTEECFILDFDPDEAAADLGSVKAAAGWKVDEDVAVISEKGQVACRDYPHSRHLCLKFPFDKTLHESHCKLCYCYVCDTAAPCIYWDYPVYGHCHASENDDWKARRELTKKIANKNLN
uniref:Uncharacterized protein n=1 Tax=Kalanchoe fedtschenkoi TaxID=63787 RepID=A0A7N0TCF9_KALFE